MLHTNLIAPVPELLRRQAAARGSKCAFRDAQTAVTYAELYDRTGKLAGHLGDNGIATGDTVAVMLPNSVAWVESCFAITRAGGVSVPISYDATEAEISYRLTDADCKAVITTGERGDLFARMKNAAPNLKTIVVDGSRELRSESPALCRAHRRSAKIAAVRSGADARDGLHSLYVRHNRSREGRSANGAWDAMDNSRLLGADHGLERARHCAIATAVVSFLRA